MLVEPAIEKALADFRKFSECTTVKMRVLFKDIATTILQIPTSELEFWGYAQVQQGLKALLTLIEATIGAAVGAGVPDRAIQLLNQWAVLDPHFTSWAKTRGTPAKESAAWHFAHDNVAASLRPITAQRQSSAKYATTRGQNSTGMCHCRRQQ